MNKYLHVFSDSPYTRRFIEFIKIHFDNNEHKFIILIQNEKSPFLTFYKEQNNTLITRKKSFYFDYQKEFKNSEKIIIHQLNKPRLMLSLLLFYPNAFKKMVWSLWGGDVYFYQLQSQSIKHKLFELFRKIVISKIPTISYWVKGDYDVISTVYKSKAIAYQAKYPSPVNLEDIKNISIKEKNTNEITIIVGNSADPFNEHIAVFKMLEKFKNKNIKICSILSYGNEKYKNKVIKSGKNIFQDKFLAITDYMSFDEYLSFLNNSDICILNHKIQQGLGNQLLFLALNKKLYINAYTTPFKHYKALDIDVFDTESILSLSFDDFVYQEEKSKTKNKVNILESMSEKVIAKEWQNIFNSKSF